MSDKMTRYPEAIVDMDIFGLAARHTATFSQPTNKEDTMDPLRYVGRHEAELSLKDDSPNAPSPNLSPEENSRLVDATAASIYQKLEPLFAELCRRLMNGETLPTPGKSYRADQFDQHAQRVLREMRDDHETRVLRSVVANIQVPLSQRIAPWGGWH